MYSIICVVKNAIMERFRPIRIDVSGWNTDLRNVYLRKLYRLSQHRTLMNHVYLRSTGFLNTMNNCSNEATTV